MSSTVLDRRLNALQQALATSGLHRIQRGIEKECLRVDNQGALAMTPHPEALGSALTHPRITTDFSEALLEFITPVCDSVDEALGHLEQIHQFVHSQLDDEMLWAASMPCLLPDDDDIPLAQYGNSNVAQMKTAYRRGLGFRYGRTMQTIAGVHYNFSLPEEYWDWERQHLGIASELEKKDYITSRYFALIRNFRRYFWLLLILFGASPAVCSSFLRGREHHLENLGEHSLYKPHATSLRMGNLGYQSDTQKRLMVCYNLLPTYIATLKCALTTEYPNYEALGLKDDIGYRQLNTNLLQIENEFYSTIRPKRVALSGEAPVVALKERGVEYIEVRCLDVNPYLPLGIDADQLRFIDTFLVYCLLQDSPETDEQEYQHIVQNQTMIVDRGRDPALKLRNNDQELSVNEWGEQLLQDMAPIAELLDQQDGRGLHLKSLEQQREKLQDHSLLPSTQLLSDIDQYGSFSQLAMAQTKRHREHFIQTPPDAATLVTLKAEAQQSLRDKQGIEQEEQIPFEDYLADFYRQYADV